MRAGFTKAPADLGAGGFGFAARKEVKLIEPADHAGPAADARFGHGEVGVAPHAGGREGLDGIRLQIDNGPDHRHDLSADVIDDALAGAVGGLDQLGIIGPYEGLEETRRNHARGRVSAAQLEDVVARAGLIVDDVAELPLALDAVPPPCETVWRTPSLSSRLCGRWR